MYYPFHIQMPESLKNDHLQTHIEEKDIIYVVLLAQDGNNIHTSGITTHAHIVMTCVRTDFTQNVSRNVPSILIPRYMIEYLTETLQ